jgi:hydroxymethylpyrimidine/phosphomethylpyrimidine kinase
MWYLFGSQKAAISSLSRVVFETGSLNLACFKPGNNFLFAIVCREDYFGSHQIERRFVKVALSIAGFDPSSGAGITADLAVFSAHGVFGTSAITALTVQSTVSVFRVVPTESALLLDTLNRLCEDIVPDGIKIGMLGSEACVHVVADFLLKIRALRPIPIVLDPILIASSGARLLEGAGVQALVERLLPVVTYATPNRQEWSVLTSADDRFHPLVESEATAKALRWPSTGFIITGGDSERPDDLLIEPGMPAQWLRAEKIVSTSTHGTGCAFSSALLCGLIAGQPAAAAAHEAKAYVRRAIQRAPGLGHGRGPLGLR